MLVKLQNIQKIHNKIIQKQLQMSMIKKYLNIYIYIYICILYIYIYISLKERQEIIDENSRIMEYQKITKVSKNSQQNNSEKVTND